MYENPHLKINSLRKGSFDFKMTALNLSCPLFVKKKSVKIKDAFEGVVAQKQARQHKS